MEYQLVTYAMAVYDVSLLLLRSRAQVRRRHSTGGKFRGNAGCPKGTSPSNHPSDKPCGFSPGLPILRVLLNAYLPSRRAGPLLSLT